MIEYPSRIELTPECQSVNATLRVPGSKSISNRALVLAALASDGKPCTLAGMLQSEDTLVMIDCLRKLGYSVMEDWPNGEVTITRLGPRRIPTDNAKLFVANSGTTIRFLTAALSLEDGRYELDGIARMRERPIGDLLDALQQLSVDAISITDNGCPPIVINANGLKGGNVTIRGNVSSQYISGLMMAAPFAENPLSIELVGEVVSQPYIDMTVKMLETWGVHVDRPSAHHYIINQTWTPLPRYEIEPDASSASYFWAMAAITQGKITVNGLSRLSLQGDVSFIYALQRMGCHIEESLQGITVIGHNLNGIDIDMNAISDTVMTLAAVACFAHGTTTIRNVGHIRHKETDRIAAMVAELRKLSVDARETSDGMTITPGPMRGCHVETYNDHRMAMSLALIGLKVPGVVIDNPGCVAKTYPGFWDDFANACKA